MSNRYNQVGLSYLLREAGDRQIMITTATGEHLLDKRNALGNGDFIPLESGGFIASNLIQGYRFVDVAPNHADSEDSSIWDYHTFNTDSSHESDLAFRDGLRTALATQIQDQSKVK